AVVVEQALDALASAERAPAARAEAFVVAGGPRAALAGAVVAVATRTLGVDGAARSVDAAAGAALQALGAGVGIDATRRQRHAGAAGADLVAEAVARGATKALLGEARLTASRDEQGHDGEPAMHVPPHQEAPSAS